MGFANEIWLAIRPTAVDGSGDGSPTNPYAVNTPDSFASVMNDPLKAAVPNVLIRLAPGVFRTRGFNGNGLILPASKRWAPLPGQRLIGAGMYSTTLRYVSDAVSIGDPGQQPVMISSQSTGDPSKDFLSSFELSELTLDLAL